MVRRKNKIVRVWVLVICTIGFLSCSGKTLANEPLLRFAIISDHRGDLDGLNTALEFIVSQNVDLLIVPGDYSPFTKAYKNGYTKWGFQIKEDLSPEDQNIYFVMGNHDTPPTGGSYFRDNISPFYPDNGPSDAPRGTIFSFDTDNAHFVITNQYHNYRRGGYSQEQLMWIDDDLKSSDKPFKFVFGHEPAFPFDRHVGNSLNIDPAMRDAFWEILVANGVTTFFCGHTHHLSVIRQKGVYQINSGEATSDHLNLGLIEVTPDYVSVRLYETNGSMPQVDGAVFNSNLNTSNIYNEDLTIIYYSDNTEPDDSQQWTCFIETMMVGHHYEKSIHSRWLEN